MAFIDWNDNYSVGITKFDEQHKVLIGYINELHDAMKIGKGKETVGEIIDSIINYADSHFKNEEDLFEQHNYPDMDSHKKEHVRLVNEVMKFKNDFEAGKLFLSIDVMNFLKDWLIKHILATDKDYTTFFEEKGV